MASISKRSAYHWPPRIRNKKHLFWKKTFDTKREAEAWVTIIQSEMTRDIYIDRSVSER